MTENARIITVFGSSHPQDGHEDYAEALELGRSLASARFAVCSGGYGGVMEAVSRGASEAGGHVLGVTSSFFKSRANRWVKEETSMPTWHERLFELVRRGDGFVACKGGTGTLVELAVVWEMLNKKAMSPRPFVVLGDFWQPIIDRVSEVERGRASRFGEPREPLVHQAPTPAEAATFLATRLAIDSSQKKEA
ncbi:MAG TPA: LOG family protein [Candidatus Acidoferrales bacterium]|nr:LOG family protein [Candidatus Acidoferrales bacterium]